MDDKYLLVGEYATRRRFSLFDFSGKFVRVVKVRNSCFSPIALKNNRMAYYYYKSPPDSKKSEYISEVFIIIKDIETGKEHRVETYKITNNQIIFEIRYGFKSWGIQGKTLYSPDRRWELTHGDIKLPGL